MLKIVGRNAKEMLMNRITEGLTAVGFEKSLSQVSCYIRVMLLNLLSLRF